MPRLAIVLALVSASHSASIPDVPPAPAPVERRGGGGKLPVVLGGLSSLAALGSIVPACRQSVRKLLGRGVPKERLSPPSDDGLFSSSDEAASSPTKKPTQPTKQKTQLPATAEAEKFALTPEKLATISELNPRLEEIVEMLASVPVFTAAVGNGTSPLTVPSEDGRKLAYFFMEHADAEAFLRAVKANAGSDLNAQIIGVSLADIVNAYSSDEAKAARETFVLIPTMAEVAAARQLIRAAGQDSAGNAADELGPGSGLIPIFWSEALAVQSAGGKQRKVLFFRVGDLQGMWRNLADARKQAGEEGAAGEQGGGDGDESMPEGPTVQVSDLQTMAKLLLTANKTDDVMFLPSSNALKMAQKQGGGEGSARARSRSSAEVAAAGAAAASAGNGAAAGAEAAAADDFAETMPLGDVDDDEEAVDI